MTADRRRQYKSGAIFQRRDGMWIGRFEVSPGPDGKRRRMAVSAKTEARCKEKLEAKKVEVARNGVPEKITGRTATVESWSNEWLSIVVRDLRPKSYATTKSFVKVWVVPTIGRKQLVNLTPADIRAVIDAMRVAGKAESSRVRAHSDLMSMFKAAMVEGHDIPQRILMVKRPKPGENDREAIPGDQAVAILRQVADRPDGSKWAAAILQGMRQAERLGLTWDCVDFEKDEIDISWQLQALPYVDPKDKTQGFLVPDGYKSRHLVQALHLVRPKTSKGARTIPMVPWMRNALLAWREVAPENPYDLVWPTTDGLPERDNLDREEWKAIQAAAGVAHPAGRRYHVHEARHATVTVLKELRAADPEMAAIVTDDVIAALVGQSKLVAAYDHSDNKPAVRQALVALAERLALVP